MNPARTGTLWSTPKFPHRGWTFVDIIDLNPDEEPSENVNYESCEVCGQYPIRFVHTLDHDDWPEPVDVGCVCAEHLTEDYVNPRAHEKELRRRATSRSRWLRRRWRTSSRGNPYLNLKGHRMAVFPSYRTDGWSCSLDGTFGELVHPTIEAAKLSLFNKLSIEHPEALRR
jgi:hypothetical protein